MSNKNSNRRFIDITSIYGQLDETRREEAYINKASNTMIDYVKVDIIKPWLAFRSRFKKDNGTPAPSLEVVLDRYLTNTTLQEWNPEKEVQNMEM